MTRVIDPGAVARAYRSALRERVGRLRATVTLAGVLSADDGPSVTYARHIGSACKAVGIDFALRRVDAAAVAAAVDDANRDPALHGIIVFYPVFGDARDVDLREQVALEKDVEALGSFWSRKLYGNVRYLDAARTRKVVVPCAPLAVVKLLTAAGAMSRSPDSLRGRTVTLFNRSDVVGRPLAAMLAHDGARVNAFDIDGPLLFVGTETHATAVTRAEALAASDIVITGVPDPGFARVTAAEIRSGAVCLNFSSYPNFAADVESKAAIVIPRVGPMTVAMLLRNTLRLYENFHR